MNDDARRALNKPNKKREAAMEYCKHRKPVVIAGLCTMALLALPRPALADAGGLSFWLPNVPGSQKLSPPASASAGRGSASSAIVHRPAITTGLRCLQYSMAASRFLLGLFSARLASSFIPSDPPILLQS